jgi:hypothetical protein
MVHYNGINTRPVATPMNTVVQRLPVMVHIRTYVRTFMSVHNALLYLCVYIMCS